ncbi:MAG: dihydrodipicolinate reductase C-terminal domain-containing protein [Bacteroidota bacterium]
MKIVLYGYGRMGQEIDRLLKEKDHDVIARLTAENAEQVSDDELRQADMVIEFTRPETAIANYKRCLSLGLPVVSGTTGWLDHWDEWASEVEAKEGSFFYASNFSLGVNLLFALNRQLAKWMNRQPDYNPRLIEIHHTGKLDAPSGTAISIAKDLIEEVDRIEDWALVNEPESAIEHNHILPVSSERIDPTPGTHKLRWASAIDELEISHIAHSRVGFAQGAIAAAEWLSGRVGVFGMEDMLNL